MFVLLSWSVNEWLGRFKAGMCDAAWCVPCTWAPLWWPCLIRGAITSVRHLPLPSTFTGVGGHNNSVRSPHRRWFRRRRRRPSHHTFVRWSSLEPSSTDYRRSSYTCDDDTVCACSEVTTDPLPLLSHDSGLRLTVPGRSRPRPPCHPSHNNYQLIYSELR